MYLRIRPGLGDDAEELVRRGFDVTAFDISDTAIQWFDAVHRIHDGVVGFNVFRMKYLLWLSGYPSNVPKIS